MIVSLVDTRTKTGNQVTMITEDSHIALFQSSVFFIYLKLCLKCKTANDSNTVPIVKTVFRNRAVSRISF